MKKILIPALLTVLIAGCGDESHGPQPRQTGFPGMVSAGGGTSGEVMARAGANAGGAAAGTPGIPQGSGGNTGGANTVGAAGGQNAGEEGQRGQAPAGGSVGGTPSIPEGSGGTASGAEMGGTSHGAAASQAAPPVGGPAEALPPREETSR